MSKHKHHAHHLNGSPARRETITPAAARKYLESMDRNRPVRKNYVDRLAAEMLAGRWEYTGETIVISEDGKLLDGQHRLHAVVKSGKAVDFLVATEVSRRAMPYIDSGASRSIGDRSVVAGLVEARGNEYAAVARCLWFYEKSGGKMISERGGSLRPTNSDVMEYIGAHKDAIGRALSLSYKVTKVLRHGRAFWAAVAVLLQRIDNDEATLFMESLGDGIGLRLNDPTYKLREQVMAAVLARRTMPSHELCLRTFAAWNAFRGRKPMAKLIIKDTGQDLPKPV